MTKIVTIFKNIKETDTPFHREVGEVLNRIREGSSKELVQKIRNEKNKVTRAELKKQLPSICFSGTFNKRADSAIVLHSGLICLDFDGYHTQKDLLSDKQAISKSEYAYSVFISPSGNGLKVLVKIPNDIDHHVHYFTSLEKYFNSPYFDKTSRNISRVCYESYDPLIYINENSSIYDKIEEREYTEVVKNVGLKTIPITDEDKIVEILLKWWTRKFPMIENHRNANLFKLLAAFNDYGVNKSNAWHHAKQYEQEDFNKDEIKTILESAYSAKDKFGTKYYEDDDRVNDIKSRLKRGASKKDVRTDLISTNVDPETADAVLDRVEKDNESYIFWDVLDKGKIVCDQLEFKRFLETNGFYKYIPDGSNEHVFVRVTNNLIDNTSEVKIKDFVLAYLLDLGNKNVYNFFSASTKLFKDDFLSLLDTISVYFVYDKEYESYLYYKNCALKITKDTITPIDYLDLGGYVWKRHVIDRNYTGCSVSDSCYYQKFVHNISGNDKERVNSVESTIGYLMSGYKHPALSPAVILNDEIISDNPEGGTGKGLFMNALSKIKNVVIINGKDFKADGQFPYQLVSDDTQILCFDDAKKYFDFERLFSVITEGISIEKKYEGMYKVPFSKSPKIAITTNYAIKGSGNSFERRKWELEFIQYYSKEFTPFDEFGIMMFDDWSDTDWCEFDNYMISCLQKYMNKGLIKSRFVNLKIRKLSAETSHEFIEWCGLLDKEEANILLTENVRTFKKNLYENFISEYPDYGPKSKMTISLTKFYKWLNAYSLFNSGKIPDEGRVPEGRWIIFPKRAEAEQLKLNI